MQGCGAYHMADVIVNGSQCALGCFLLCINYMGKYEMNQKNNKRKSSIIQGSIAALALVLIGLIVAMMMIVSDIQGTARIVNYAGLVRGKTQRIVKLEISNHQEDAMLASVESFIHGLRDGDDTLQLVRLEDDDFQNKMTELDEYFSILKKEIMLVRENGADGTEIIPISENFFNICDEATGLAEAYSQRKASSLAVLEKYITADIILLMILLGYEFVKALRYAMMNRALQKKVYLDKATGLPNKNKCEELLGDTDAPAGDVGVLSFDLNNLRRINNSMGHEAGDAYIRRFALCLRAVMPAPHFIGRAGGDEFLGITHGLGEKEMHSLLAEIRAAAKEESKAYPDTPLSYAVGFALAADHPGTAMRDLYILADKNMYIDKNHVKKEEAAEEKKLNFQLLRLLNRYGKNFSACIYCDARLDTYRTIRESDDFFLASDGSYTGAVEQLIEEQVGKEDRSHIYDRLQREALGNALKKKGDILELPYHMPEDAHQYGRLAVIPVDWDADGQLHHFLLAFQWIRESSAAEANTKEQLTLYYEQLKQSILENDSYVDALLDMADCIYTVNLTKDILERSIIPAGKSEENKKLVFDYPLPCSYREYCSFYIKKVTKETVGSYRITESADQLLKRFAAGEKHLTVEYCLQQDDGNIQWIQKTVLMIQNVVLDEETGQEMPEINAIVLLQDTTHLHERDEQEHAKLQAAFDEMRTANRTKTEFLSRMSHDIRTPLNGIIGLLKINEDHFEDKALVLKNQKKMHIAANHLLSLINDVLQMSKLEEGNIVLSHEPLDLNNLSQEIVTIIIGRAQDEGLQWIYEKEKSAVPCPYVYGSPLHLRQIFLNIYGNCIKYNRPGGSISTSVQCIERVAGHCTYQWVISDTGVGMSQDFVKHIFEPFTQERQDARSVYHGTGLGMTIVKGLIEKMGGTITVTSQEGVGSTFTITIPFEIAPSPTKESEKPVIESSIRGVHLLLAEDNDLNAEIAEMLLADRGANVHRVKDGKEAVETFEKEKPGTFDAILMDVMMPVMNGFVATKTIRQLPRADAKTIPIIAMTANAFNEDAQKCLKIGMNAHLSKPLEMGKVITTIAQCIKN